MQSFSTEDTRHKFEVDGTQYFLPGFDFDDIEEAAQLGSIPAGKDQIAAFRDFMAGRARSPHTRAYLFMRGRRSPAAAIRSLGPNQLGELFTAWSGLGKTSGEASGSQVLPTVTEAR